MSHEAGLMVESADSPDTGLVVGVARFTYAFRPVVLRGSDGDIAFSVVEHQFTGDIGFGVGIAGYITLGLDLPVLIGQVGDDLSGSSSATRIVGDQPIPIAGLGDPGLRAKFTLVKPKIVDGLATGFGLAIDERFTLPLGDERSFIGEGSVASETRVWVEGGKGPVYGHFAAGVKLRSDAGSYACDPDLPVDSCASRFGHEIPVIAGLELRPKGLGIDPERRGTLYVEAYGRIPVDPVTPDESTAPMQFYASVGGRARFDDFALFGAVEVGLTDGIGNAPFRATLGVSFAPEPHDSDGDHIGDDRDRCPSWAEDYDHFEDNDGCPELDNDGDGVPDVNDHCPEQRGTSGDSGDGCPAS
ncbi:MAG: hypothetical protein U0271_15880 [Polyangiaceae bacterium]